MFNLFSFSGRPEPQILPELTKNNYRKYKILTKNNEKVILQQKKTHLQLGLRADGRLVVGPHAREHGGEELVVLLSRDPGRELAQERLDDGGRHADLFFSKFLLRILRRGKFGRLQFHIFFSFLFSIIAMLVHESRVKEQRFTYNKKEHKNDNMH